MKELLSLRVVSLFNRGLWNLRRALRGAVAPLEKKVENSCVGQKNISH